MNCLLSGLEIAEQRALQIQNPLKVSTGTDCEQPDHVLWANGYIVTVFDATITHLFCL